MNKIISTYIISLLVVVNVYAETTCESLNTDISALQTTVTQQQTLVSKLSDDIGTMADRINVVADKIVATEKLLSETLLAITGKSIVIYVDSNNALTNAWAQVADLAGTNSNAVYIAVQSIDGSVISGLSNSAKLTLQ